MKSLIAAALVTGMAVAVLGLAGCASRKANPPAASPGVFQVSSSPVLRHAASAPTSYVTYASRAGHFQINVPQGLTRIESADKVTFAGKAGGESVQFASGVCASGDPRVVLAGAVMHAGDFVANVRLEPIDLPAGPAYRAEYETSATAPGAGDERAHFAALAYLLRRDGRCALITLWAPFGAQDVDQWQRVAQSFRWR